MPNRALPAPGRQAPSEPVLGLIVNLPADALVRAIAPVVTATAIGGLVVVTGEAAAAATPAAAAASARDRRQVR